jgi:pimeloyl-ACP methyl ester carboxylesterase
MTIKKGYVDTRDGQVHYRYSGKGEGLPLVCFHQTASSSASYEKMMGLLEGPFPMFTLDTPGFGQSFSPPGQPTIAYYVTILLEALANLGVSRFHAFGHHTGGAIAAQMAADFPERVRSVMIEGPVWVSENVRKKKLDTIIDPLVLKEDGSHLMKVWDRVRRLDPDHPLEVCHRESIDTLLAGTRYHEAYIAVYTQDSYAVYERIRCPMLILCGRNDVLFPFFEEVREAHPKATFALLENCGTYAVDNCAEQIVEEVRAFLKGLGP